MVALTVKALTKHYGKTVGIDGIDLDVADGEFLVILGPSGAGKTTTLKSIAGLVEVDDGTVDIGGVDMTLVEPYHRNVAMAFESYALYPQKTVSENLASPLKSGRTGKYSEDEQKRRIDAVTKTLGINHLLERFPRELSNGQRQRVALGRVLVRPADVYLLDEPLSHLDAKLRAAMRAELRQLGQMSNTTTVYVTHDYQEALALGDRIAILREGRLVQIDTPANIWHAPADTFVARSLGQPEINVFDAAVDGAALRVLGTELEVAIPADISISSSVGARIGIRPCDIEIRADYSGNSAAVAVRGRIQLVERLGRNVELSIDLGGGVTMIGLSSGGSLAVEGAEIVVEVARQNIHLFEGAPEGTDSRRLGSAIVGAGRTGESVTTYAAQEDGR
ncbi:MAG: ABC transporter ATP-binding protein [Rhodococcus sp.]|nr:ABC transporter ATP-binding protein [Rhodococcus sp. (in: high G+C Gram-positive bacteria)]